MYRLTILYNIPDDTSEEDFLEWRLGEHQRNNEAMPGVIRTDFMRIDDTVPRGAKPPYRFMTIAEWKDKESFEASFYGEGSQEGLEESLKRLADYIFVIGEVLIEAKLG